MNINEQMHDLGDMGALAYAPSDALISSLVSKTRRVRAMRQGSATVVGTVGALAVGIAAVQAYGAATEDPAFRDRNVINNKDGLTPIELYRAKFGNDNPTRSYESTVDLSSIIARLKAAAAGGSSQPGSVPQQTVPAPAQTSTSTPPAAPAATSPADPYSQCRLDHPDQPYKQYDCATSQWIVNSGWYQDPANAQYYQCSAQPPYVGYTYDCSTGRYTAMDGYFWFGNGAVYPAVNWLDAATGSWSVGNWSGTGNWGGWDQKAIQLDSGSKIYREYVYLGSKATWSGSTCTGISSVKYGAAVKASCLPEWRVANQGLTYAMADGIAWVADNQSLKWHPCLFVFADPAAPPPGWSWNGSAWVEVPSA